jgi:hypothetical protein
VTDDDHVVVVDRAEAAQVLLTISGTVHDPA